MLKNYYFYLLQQGVSYNRILILSPAVNIMRHVCASNNTKKTSKQRNGGTLSTDFTIHKILTLPHITKIT